MGVIWGAMGGDMDCYGGLWDTNETEAARAAPPTTITITITMNAYTRRQVDRTRVERSCSTAPPSTQRLSSDSSDSDSAAAAAAISAAGAADGTAK